MKEPCVNGILTKEKIIGIIFMKLATHMTTYRRRVELWQISEERRQGCRRWWRRRGAKVGTWACSFSPRNQDAIFGLGLLLRRRPFGAGGTGGSAPSASLFPSFLYPGGVDRWGARYREREERKCFTSRWSKSFIWALFNLQNTHKLAGCMVLKQIRRL